MGCFGWFWVYGFLIFGFAFDGLIVLVCFGLGFGVCWLLGRFTLVFSAVG